MNSRLIDTVAIIGVGLIGGSFGMALRKRSLAGNVIGIGRSPERLQRAVELGAVDCWSTDLETGVREADLIYVSTPVGLEVDFIRQIVPFARDGAIITDAGSTKSVICRGADALMRDGLSFVGAHPMAGSEAAGVEAANPDLFVNAAYILTPTERTDAEALSAVRRVAESIGSRVYLLDPETHDRCVAVISHLPHLMAAALVQLAKDRSERDSQIFDLIAGSFRDMTRVAGSSPVLWKDICLSNADALRDAVNEFGSILQQALRAIESGDADAVEDWFARARDIRNAVSNEHKERRGGE